MVSCVRNGLTFRKVVTAWKPERTFAFTIALDPEAPAPAPYDGIGGPYLELLSARYTAAHELRVGFPLSIAMGRAVGTSAQPMFAPHSGQGPMVGWRQGVGPSITTL